MVSKTIDAATLKIGLAVLEGIQALGVWSGLVIVDGVAVTVAAVRGAGLPMPVISALPCSDKSESVTDQVSAEDRRWAEACAEPRKPSDIGWRGVQAEIR
ncbi:MAG: hypothetical protein U0231_03075 [Nitrospiraceae bacterium]